MASGSRSPMDSELLWHNPQSSDVIWSPDEQVLLEKLIIVYASEPNLTKYSKIAEYFNGKTVRDVAFRIKWTTDKMMNENGIVRNERRGTKRPFDDQSNIVPSSPCNHPYKLHATVDAVAMLVEENNRAFDRITSNFCSLQIDENIYLLSQAKNNIFMIFNYMHENVDLMKHMPPLDETLNIELANYILF